MFTAEPARKTGHRVASRQSIDCINPPPSKQKCDAAALTFATHGAVGRQDREKFRRRAPETKTLPITLQCNS
jgi:hypothetical protein